MKEIVVAVVMLVMLGGLLYIYFDVRLHPGSYIKKPRKNKKNRKRFVPAQRKRRKPRKKK